MAVSSTGESRLASARAKFEPLSRFLGHLSRVTLRKYDQHATLEQRDGFQETARNTYEVRYSLCRGGDDQPSLSFILTGDNADLVLVQDNQPPQGESPGQVDQRVYRLDEMDDLKAAVQEKIISQLKAVA